MLMPILTTRPPTAASVGSPSETAMRILDMLDRHILAGERMPPEALTRMMEALSDVMRLAPLPEAGAQDFTRRIAAFIEHLPPELRQIAVRAFNAHAAAVSARPSPFTENSVKEMDEAVETAGPRRETAVPAGLVIRDTAEQQRQAPVQAWSQLQAAVPGMPPSMPGKDPEHLQVMLREAFGDDDDRPKNDRLGDDRLLDDRRGDGTASDGHAPGEEPAQQPADEDGEQTDAGDAATSGDDSASVMAEDASQTTDEAFVAVEPEGMLDTDGTYTILASGLGPGHADDVDADDATITSAALALPASLPIWAGPIGRTTADAAATVAPLPAATGVEAMAPVAASWPTPGASAIASAGFAAIHRASESARRARLRPTPATPVRDVTATTSPTYDLAAVREPTVSPVVAPQYEFSHRRDTAGKSPRKDGIAGEPGRASVSALGQPIGTQTLPKATTKLSPQIALGRDSGAADVYEVYRMLGGLG